MSRDVSDAIRRLTFDTRPVASVRAAFERVRTAHGRAIASVIHLAAYFDLTGEVDSRYETVTVLGTQRLLKALASFDCGQFIFMSTLLVHAPSGHGHRIDETAPLDESLPYPASKIRTERLLHEQRGACLSSCCVPRTSTTNSAMPRSSTTRSHASTGEA